MRSIVLSTTTSSLEISLSAAFTTTAIGWAVEWENDASGTAGNAGAVNTKGSNGKIVIVY